MFDHSLRYLCGVVFLVALLAPAPGQDGGEFYKKPETTAEFWRFLNHEIEVGQFKVAAGYLKGFIAKNPTDEELLQIQERDGSSSFLRLLTIPELRGDAKALVERVDAVVLKHLADRTRLEKMIKKLNEDPEERQYATGQIRRSGALAVPALIEALIRTENDVPVHTSILTILPKLEKSAVPPLIAALDAKDPILQAELLDVMRKRGDISAAPYLWYMMESPNFSDAVHERARNTLAGFLGVKADKLPSAKVALALEAERYYQHKVKFLDDNAVTVWSWDGKQLNSKTMTAGQAEEYYGLRFARQALDLDPSYTSAQMVFLSLALDKAVERAGLDQPLAKSLAVRDLLTSVNPELVTAVLERALSDNRLTVILGATRALGALAEVRAAKRDDRRSPALVRALNYPDRRVQMAAAEALLQIPNSAGPVTSVRVVDVLRRFVGTDLGNKVLIADFDRDRSGNLAAAVKKAGYETVVVQTGNAALERLSQRADIDVIAVNATIPMPLLPGLLAQLRTDIDIGRTPLFVTAAADRVEALQRQWEPRYRNVWVIAEATSPAELKAMFAEKVTQAAGKPLTDVERKDYAARSIEWLARLARGEVSGYDIRPAQGAILEALRSKELANLAIEAAGHLSGRDPQQALASLVLDGGRPAELRSKAAVELCRHIQQFGLALSAAQVKGIEDQFAASTDAKLKGNLALVLGSTHPTPRQTGERLQRYSPSFSAPPAAKPKEEKTEESKDN